MPGLTVLERRRNRAELARPAARRGPAVVLALLAAVSLGVVIGRASAPTPAPPDAPAPAPPQTAAEEPAWAGPTGMDDGVPVGYQRSEAGAVAAAAQYARALSGEATLDDRRRGAVLDVAAAAAARAELDEAMRPGAKAVRRGLGLPEELLAETIVVSREAPVGYQVTAYDGRRAAVELWSTGLLVVEGVQGFDAGWVTTTIELVWERNDWRLAAMRSVGGPSPNQAGPDTAGDVAREMAALEEFWYVPAR